MADIMKGERQTCVFRVFFVLVVMLAGGCTGTVAPGILTPTAEVLETTATAPATATDAPPLKTATAVMEATAPAEETAVAEETALAATEDGSALAAAGIALDTASPLIEGVTLETVPVMGMVTESGPRDLVQPAHTVLRLEGYMDTGNYRPAQIVIYPLAAYETLALKAQQQVERLHAFLVAGGDAVTVEEALPYLPVANAAQILQARARRITFQNGEGVRYLTQFVQDTSPVVSSSLLYTFQGLTEDGRFWVSAEAPVGSEALPEDIAAAQEQGFDSFTYSFDRTGYDAYLAEQKALVEGLTDEAFYPDLAALDALMQSLDLTDYEGPDVAEWAPEVAPSPAQVVDAFLKKYLAAGGFAAGAHRDNPHLHDAFLEEVEQLAGDIRGSGGAQSAYDPILMSMFGPAEEGDLGYGFQDLEVGAAWSEGEEATALVARKWHYTGVVSPLRYALRWSGEAWQISGVSSNVAPVATEGEEMAEALMTSMTAATGRFETVDDWQDAVALDFVAPNASLSLCDQSWPVGFAIEGSFVQPAPLHLSSNVEEEAYVVVYLPSKRGALTVRLVREEAKNWRVSEMICGDRPEGRALAFYVWYLDAAQQAGETRWAERAPEIDGMNAQPTFVTDDFLRAAQMQFQEDVYLPPARVPDRFVVQLSREEGAAENEVLLYLEYLGEGETVVEVLALEMERVGDSWLVSGVQQVVD